VQDDDQGMRFVRKIGSSIMAITGGFVYLDAEGNESGDMQTFGCSAFAMSFGGVPVLVTAGHVIQDVLDPIIVRHEYEGHPLRLLQVNILDCFGEKPLVKKPTPFPVYPDLRRGAIDEATKRDSMGLDFGVIFLPDLYWNGFFANDGRILAEDIWAQEGETFDVYKMVGIPAEPQHSKNGHGRLGVFSFLEASDPDVPMRDGKPVWFIGNMPVGMTSVAGVSGGPIFGFRKLPTGGWEHKIVAMQSWQKEGKNGLVYGTPLRSFGPVISWAIESLAKPDGKQEAK
jgi:hypothetical protein